jgi:hypothetical protein
MANPVELVLQTLRDYDQIAPEEILRRENLVPHFTPERSLFYAIYVSQPGVRAKKLETLKSRWWVTNTGAGGLGLEKGQGSPAHAQCSSFLADRFLARLQVLLGEAVATAVEKAGSRKTPDAKRNVFLKAAEKLQAEAGGMNPVLPGAEEGLARALEQLRQ